MTGIERLCPQLALPRPSPPAQFSQHAASKTLLHNLHHGGLGTPLRFADQQMNMLGHNHVPGYDETITGTATCSKISGLMFQSVKTKAGPALYNRIGVVKGHV